MGLIEKSSVRKAIVCDFCEVVLPIKYCKSQWVAERCTVSLRPTPYREGFAGGNVKRFTDTDKWKNPWFRRLSPRNKLLWIWMLDSCDSVGVLYFDLEHASFFIGEEISEEGFFDAFGDHVVRLSESKVWVVEFVQFQYGTLNPGNKVHLGIMRSLVKLTFGLPLTGDGAALIDFFKKFEKGVPEGQVTLQEKEKEKEKNVFKKRGGVGEKKNETPLVEIWNQHRGSLAAVRGASATRLKHAESRWSENPSTEYWAEIVTRIARSPFCQGNNDRGWKADFDFLIRPDTQHKVLEGKYDSKTKTSAPLKTFADLEAGNV